MGSGEMSSQNNSITLGREGTGIVYMRGGTWKKTGTAAVTLRVRERTGAFGLVSGWGEITTSKKYTIDNNGLVVANGMDDSGVAEERTLAYSATGDLSYFTNSLENVTTNGWYAVNKGKLTMQVLASVASGDLGTYTWGEAEDDDAIDLVNSVRVSFHNITDETTKKKGIYSFTGHLYAADRSDVPALPGGAAAVGVWSFDISGLYETADFEFRYDHVKAPNGVKLYQLRSDGETWTKLETESLADYRVKVSGIPCADASRMFAAVAAAPSGLAIFVR